MTAPDTIRIRRIWNDGVLIVDAPEGVSIESQGEGLGIDMSNLPESFVFEMKIYDAAAPAPAVQPHEAALTSNPSTRPFSKPATGTRPAF